MVSRGAPKLSLLLPLAIFALLAIAPLGLMLLESFGIHALSIAEPDPATPTIAGPTLEAYRNVLATPVEREQLWNSTWISLLTAVFAVLLGSGTAWLSHRTDLPLARWIGPLAVLPLLFPPTITTVAFNDFFGTSGLIAIAFVLAVNLAPFTAALTARGLRQVDGRLFEASLLARGRLRAELTLGRQVLPDILAGALLVAVYAMSERGVPYVLSANNRGKTWTVYSEAAFTKWSVPGLPESLKSAEATAFALPLVALSLAFALLCLVARRRGTLVTMLGDFRPLPIRRLHAWKWPALAGCLVLPVFGLVLPTICMVLWTAGSTANLPLSFATVRASFRTAFRDWQSELIGTNLWSAVAGVALIAIAIPLAWHAARARKTWIETLSMCALGVPCILLGIGIVRLWNRPGSLLGTVYDSPVMLVSAYATRFLPLGVLAIANAFRRLPRELGEVAALTRRAAPMHWQRIYLPLIRPTLVSVWILVFLLSMRELDLAVLLLPGNAMAIRRVTDAVHFGYEDSAGAVVLILLFCAAMPLVLRTLIEGKTAEATT